MQRGPADGFGDGPDAPEDLRRALDHLQVEARALREALERTARFAHAADPSTSHVAEFDRCPHPTCRQARALLDDHRAVAAAPAPEARRTPAGRRPPVADRAPDLEGPPGAAEAGEDNEPSWIPLDRPDTPPPRRPVPLAAPAETPQAPPAAEHPEPAEPPTPSEPPIRPEPPVRPEPPIRPEPPVEPPAPPEPPAAEGPPPAPLAEEPGPPSWGPPAVDLPPEAASAEDEAMAAEEAEDASRSPAAAHAAASGAAGRERPPAPAPGAVREPNIADAAADAIDRLARALFGPKRPRH